MFHAAFVFGFSCGSGGQDVGVVLYLWTVFGIRPELRWDEVELRLNRTQEASQRPLDGTGRPCRTSQKAVREPVIALVLIDSCLLC